MEALIYWMKEINKLLPLCPSRKHLPNASEALPAPRKLTEFELCTMVLALTMRHVLTQYNSAHGTTFACGLGTLVTRLLKRAAEQVQTNHDLLNQYKSIASGQDGANTTGKSGRIPKKACFASKELGELSHSDSHKKKGVTSVLSGNLRSRTLTGSKIARSGTKTAHAKTAETAASVGASEATFFDWF